MNLERFDVTVRACGALQKYIIYGQETLLRFYSSEVIKVLLSVHSLRPRHTKSRSLWSLMGGRPPQHRLYDLETTNPLVRRQRGHANW